MYRKLAAAWKPLRTTLAIACVATACASCTEDVYLNLTSPLGDGDQVGSRSDFSATFVNNTPYRAIFTVAAFNHFNQQAVPNDVQQFADGQDDTAVLEGNTAAGPFTFQCNRALSIGGIQMLERLVDSAVDPSQLNQDALMTGVGFSAAALGDPLATLPTEGTADPLDIWQGSAFQCESLIVVTFEQDPNAPGGFRIDYDVILPP